jgi:CDGSH-type Zn-finger protein
MRIKITANGPYLVTGGVPLKEKIIVPQGKSYVFKEGRQLPQAASYALCRCGKSNHPPFCDGSLSGHLLTKPKLRQEAVSTIARSSSPDRPWTCSMTAAVLLPDSVIGRRNAWSLTLRSDNPKYRDEAIIAATDVRQAGWKYTTKTVI